MRSLKVLSPLFVLVVLIAIAAPNAGAAADPQNLDTYLTFSSPVLIPGVVLTPGTYEFKLVDFSNFGYLVEVRNAKGELLETVNGIPAYRSKVTDNTVVTFEKRGPGEPEAINTWFYPDRNDGVQFLYPKTKNVEPAAAAQ